MDERDAGAQRTVATPRRKAPELFFGRRYRLHRFIALCAGFVLVVGIVYGGVAIRSAALAELPGVERVDGSTQEIFLRPESTADQLLEVLHRARDRSADWTLVLGPARLPATPTGPDADDRATVTLLLRLGAASGDTTGAITLGADGSSVTAETPGLSGSLSAASALIAMLTADGAVPVDRLEVDRRVIVTGPALRRPEESVGVLVALRDLPNLAKVVLGDRSKVRVRAPDVRDAAGACAAARQLLGERDDLELSVSFDSGADSRRC